MEPSEFIRQKFNITDNKNPGVLKGIARDGLFRLYAELGYKVGAEVGLEKGKNAAEMFINIPDLKLYGIDPYVQHSNCSYEAAAHTRKWNQDYLNRVKAQAVHRMTGRNAVIIEKFSEDAVKDFEDNSLDFVYIDADHSYDFVMQDVILWGRKVRRGGILSGHDYYYDNEKPGRRAKVTQAINDYTRVHGIKFFITDEDHYVMKGDVYPSWLWVKEKEIWPNVVGF
jgi:hypothetical protein